MLRTLAICLLLCAAAHAQQAQPMAADPVLEARLIKLANELRCLVCQNETIAASNAELAVDLRNQVREKLRAGASDQEIIDYLVARYGDFILYRPPVKATTIGLWVGPFVLLAFGVFALYRHLMGRNKQLAGDKLADADLVRAQQLLNSDDRP